MGGATSRINTICYLTLHRSLVTMASRGYSDFCSDLTTRWDRNTARCVPCTLKPGRSLLSYYTILYYVILYYTISCFPLPHCIGYEITPNCGYDDHGGRHEPPNRVCQSKTFNTGSRAHCQPCSSCPPEYTVARACDSTSDTQCEEPR